jgi:3-dehydroquinate dehydratase/shikimate dehydrogenase
MRATGAEVVKLAVTASRLSDALPLLDLGRRGARYAPTIVIGMGDAGIATRVLAAHFGSRWTYAGQGIAPGQLSPQRLLGEFAFRQITDRTEVYGVVGSPVMHSVSPAMHNAAFRSERIDAIYLPLAAADVDDFLQFATACGLRGASVTVPFKVELFDRLDEPDAVSRRVGAVNTIRYRDGRWQGTNTDVAGFLGPLRGRVRLAGARVSVLGAGGAARAVGAALVAEGSRVTIFGRNQSRVAETARRVGAEIGDGVEPEGGWDLLINTTPLGMTPNVDATPFPSARFDGRLVYDLVYNPPRTRLLREAHAAGCDTIGGLDMLVAQAQEQSEWWTGHRPSHRVLRDAAEARLQAFQEESYENHVV